MCQLPLTARFPSLVLAGEKNKKKQALANLRINIPTCESAKQIIQRVVTGVQRGKQQRINVAARKHLRRLEAD